MNRFFKFLLCGLVALGMVSCSDDNPLDKPQPDPEISFEITPDLNGKIMLGAAAESKFTFTVKTDAAWRIESDGNLFSVNPTAPTAHDTAVEVTALEENPTTETRKLGSLSIICPEAERTVRLEVIQDGTPEEKPQSRTILLYMPGTNLLSFYKTNIELCRKAVAAKALGENNRLVICYQPFGQQSASLFGLRYNAQKKECEEVPMLTYDHFEASSEESVRKLFEDVYHFAPASQYGLIIGSHGKAWIPAQTPLMRPCFAVANAPTEEEFWCPKEGAKPTRAFGDSNHSMDITTLGDIFSSMNFRFDFLIFDACFMSNIETLYDLRSAADYIVASPCEIMAAGFPYDRILPHLFAPMPIEEALGKVCHTYWDFYMHDWETDPGNEPSGCIALTRTRELDALAASMRQVTSAKQDFDLSKLQYYEGLDEHVFFDLGHFVELSCDDETAKARFREQLDRTFPKESRLHTDIFYSVYNGKRNPIHHYTGVTTSEPSLRYREQNQNTAWYQTTH